MTMSSSEALPGDNTELASTQVVVTPISDYGMKQSKDTLESVENPDQNDWSHGLFGCLNDIPTFLLTCLCPCVAEVLVAAKAQKIRWGFLLSVIFVCLFFLRIGYLVSFVFKRILIIEERKLDEDDKDREKVDRELYRLQAAINLILLIIVILALIRVAFGVAIRKRIRNLFNISDPTDVNQDWKDLFSVCCCYSCVLCQEKSTIDQLTNSLVYQSSNLT